MAYALRIQLPAYAMASRATAFQVAGNIGQAASVAYRRAAGHDPPLTVTITTGLPTATTDRNTAFSFVSSEPGSTFARSLDGGSFAACTEPDFVLAPHGRRARARVLRSRHRPGR